MTAGSTDPVFGKSENRHRRGDNEGMDKLFEQYETLILQRDRLEKEAEQYRMNYFREFGELITDAFLARIDCIALKKSIAFCQAKRNAGEEIDPISMQEYIDKSMLAYNAQLQDLQRQRDEGKSLVPISILDAEEIKRIYRRVAKRFHPDICPLTAEEPGLMELFQRVLLAYRANDLKAIREAEILINRFMKEHGEEPPAVEIEDLPEKIEEIESDIAEVMETEPYTYKYILEDPSATDQKRCELEAEKESYLEYKKELQAHLESLIAG